ncbi:TetR/AcrR family transcriptional regulator [Pseudonocardia sp. CA-107938]|uniref:TetR/AcrR family transcriptional regulator n=1 Tax=Pseudonocardia sp. CA-107938 TaxID=3240021 RepID=UPI003D8BEED4
MPEVDGRRRRGQERRRALLDAALAVIGRDGLAAVSQRSVAAEAGVPPSAVYYYFATLDDLVDAALVEVNDRCITELRDAATAADPVRAVAAATVDAGRRTRGEALAELELWLLAARTPRHAPELQRWDAELEAVAAALTDDPVAVDAVTAALTGYYWQAATGDGYDVDRLEAILRRLTR